MPTIIEGAEMAASMLEGTSGDLVGMLDDPDLGELEGEKRIAKAPNVSFFLRHWPADWTVEVVDGVPTLLPDLGPHVLRPGANGIRTRDRGEAISATYEEAIREAIREGWVYIPRAQLVTDPSHLPPGVGPGKYIREVKCRDRRTGAEGVYFTEAWNVPVPTPRGQDQGFKFHREPYNRWRASLVRSAIGAADGLIDPPMEAVLERLRQRHGDRLGRIKARPTPDPADRAQKVEAAQRAAELVDQAAAPKKAPKATGRKA